jgi:hypothetical protein
VINSVAGRSLRGSCWRRAAKPFAALRCEIVDTLAEHHRVLPASFGLDGAGRKLAIIILEFFDRCGVTVRRGDLRRLRPGRAQGFAGDDVAGVNSRGCGSFPGPG